MNVKKDLRFGFVISFILLLYSVPKAQEVQVKNVRFEDRDETVAVRYDLDGLIGKKYKIKLLLSDDFGVSFKIRPRTVHGDLGKNIKPGNAKEIIWDLKKDFSDGLRGDGFVFAVDAELQKGGSKWPYIIGSAGVVVVVGYFMIRPRNGSIVIDISKEF